MDGEEARAGFAGGQNYGAQIGTSHGVINNNVYLHHITDLPRLVPSNTVPFRRDPDFVERGVLEDIFDRAAAPAARVALVGLGGVGKSQLAIEYAHRISEAQPNTWVFWVHASTPERFKDSYRKIAEKVHLPKSDDSSEHVLNKVCLWLSNVQNGKWLMILDNADNEQVLFQSDVQTNGPQQQPLHRTSSLSEYLPQSSNGSILVTTRSRQVAFRITGRDPDILPVKPMDPNVSVTLLQKKLRDSSDRAGMLHLGEQVGYMPLALTQAAAYINQRSPHINLRSYIERLRRGNQDQLRLLQTDLGDPRRDGATSNSIILTLQISLDHIHHVSPSAASLLIWMSMFDRESVPIEFLDGTYPNSVNGLVRGDPQFQLWSNLKSRVSMPSITQAQNLAEEISDRLADDIAILKTYDLIHHGTSGATLNMHRLVQLSAWKWIDNNPGGLEQYQIQYISFMWHQLPDRPTYAWPRYHKLFQHIMMLALIHVTHRESIRRRSFVLYYAGKYTFSIGQAQTGEHLLRESLQGYQFTDGYDSRAALRVGLALSTHLYHQGKMEGLETVSKHQLEQQRKRYGDRDLETVQSMELLSLILDHSGDSKASAKLCEEALVNSEDLSLHPDPHDLAIMLMIRGRMLQRLGRHNEAIEAFKQRIAACETKSRIDPIAPMSIHDLAESYYRSHNYEQAQKLHETMLAARIAEMGADHPHTMSSMAALSYTLYHQGKVDEAEKLCRKVLHFRQQNLGSNYLTYSMTCHLAQILRVTNRIADAVKLYEKGLEGLSRYPSWNLEHENGWREGYAQLRRTLGLDAQARDLTIDTSEVQMEENATEEVCSVNQTD